MAKTTYKRKKDRTKLYGYIFCGLVVALVVVIIAQMLLPQPAAVTNTELYITEDGHVHMADGSHIGTYEEMFGEAAYEVTEDGHVHTADGVHLGTYLPTTAADATTEAAE
ncbi:MAG: hypothetical protein IJ461_08445 [Clostridia bacterium]|nr:hypothetical protein [Clostridia bacterium]